MAVPDRSTFAALLADPGGALVACDYDGTLAPIVADPAQAVPAPGAVEALAALSASVARVAVITGRPALEVVRLGGLAAVPDLIVLGLYGAEGWAAGELTAAAPPHGLAAAEAEITRLLKAPELEGVVVEQKGASVAVHTRRAPEPERALDQLRDPLGQIALSHGLRVEPGRLVLELRAPGVDKGSALLGLAVADPPSRAVLYAGDDLGDLPAFATVASLRSRGVDGWSVAAASTEAPEVAAAADVEVAGPAGVVALLADLAAALRT